MTPLVEFLVVIYPLVVPARATEPFRNPPIP